MKPEEIETYKFRAESLKQIGLILCTPISVSLLRILINELELITTFKDIKTYISCILFAIGFTMVNRALTIMDLIKEKLN